MMTTAKAVSCFRCRDLATYHPRCVKGSWDTTDTATGSDHRMQLARNHHFVPQQNSLPEGIVRHHRSASHVPPNDCQRAAPAGRYQRWVNLDPVAAAKRFVSPDVDTDYHARVAVETASMVHAQRSDPHIQLTG